MLSRDNLRQSLEWTLRAASLMLLAWMVWMSLAPQELPVARRGSDSRSLPDSLAAWTLDPGAESLHVSLDTMPDRVTRRWLVALRGAGAAVSWSSPPVTPVALEVEPLNDPDGGVRMLIAARDGARVAVSDALGSVDTVVMRGPVAELRTSVLRGVAGASVGARAARAVAMDSLASRGVLVLGRAGWEAKFVIAALEERGWQVAARLAVAPGVDVRQGGARLDTAHVGVVVALDTTAARDASRIARFVRAGGGLVLAGDAARSAAFSALAVGRVGPRVSAAAISVAADAPRRSLGFFSLIEPVRGAVPLELRDGRLAAAARRIGAGRVVQMGYDETWRWRLGGGDGAPEAHRDWWSSVVGGASYRAARQLAVDTARIDPAPIAATFAALGAQTRLDAPAPTPHRSRYLAPWMLALLFATLLAEWASRRFRGVP